MEIKDFNWAGSVLSSQFNEVEAFFNFDNKSSSKVGEPLDLRSFYGALSNEVSTLNGSASSPYSEWVVLLYCAILNDAILTVRDPSRRINLTGADVVEAKKWFINKDHGSISLDNVCEVLKLDAGRVRSEVLEYL